MFGPVVGFVFFGIGCMCFNEMLKFLYFYQRNRSLPLLTTPPVNTIFGRFFFFIICKGMIKKLQHLLGLLENEIIRQYLY